MDKTDILLGVNIDPLPPLRQARGTLYPEPIQAALVAEQARADGITAHLPKTVGIFRTGIFLIERHDSYPFE